MKVFLDTNVFAEYIFERNQFISVQRIFEAILIESYPIYRNSFLLEANAGSIQLLTNYTSGNNSYLNNRKTKIKRNFFH